MKTTKRMNSIQTVISAQVKTVLLVMVNILFLLLIAKEGFEFGQWIKTF